MRAYPGITVKEGSTANADNSNTARATGVGAGLPDFDDYEGITQLPLYRGQIVALARWVKGQVLDVGSSYGRFSALSPTIVSLDLDTRALLRGIELGNIHTAVRGSALALPFDSGTFDTILSIGVAEHVPLFMLSSFLEELTRVAKPGGRLVITATSPYAPFSLLRLSMWRDRLHPVSPFRLRSQLRRRNWRPLVWISTGLLGVTRLLPSTVTAPVPWARTVTQVFCRS